MLAPNEPVTVIDFEGRACRLRNVAYRRGDFIEGTVEWWWDGSYSQISLMASAEGVGWARGHDPETELALLAAWKLSR